MSAKKEKRDVDAEFFNKFEATELEEMSEIFIMEKNYKETRIK